MATKTKMSLEEFKKKLNAGEWKDFSSTFNENVQTAFTARTFNRLRFEPRIAKLLFVPLLLSIPFDPFTGETSTDGFNFRKPFRPDVRPAEFLAYIKQACNEDEKLKKHYMDMAGFSGKWDTSKPDFTDQDRSILFIYRRPMSVARPSIRINSQAITGEKYGGAFLLGTKQDETTGEYIGEISNLHRLGLLLGNVSRLEVNSFNEALEKQEANCISLDLGRSFVSPKTFTEIKDPNSNEAKTIRGQIRSSYPLGGVSPLTVMPMIGIDVTPIKGEHKHWVTNADGEEVEELLPQFRKTINFEGSFLATDKYAVHDKVDSVIGKYFPKDPSRKKERNEDSDVYPDFCVLEYITDNEASSFDNDQDKIMAAQKMETKTERTPLFHRKKGWSDPELEQFFEYMGEFYDFIKKDNFIDRMPQLLFANYKTATEVIAERAEKIFSEQYPLSEFPQLYSTEVLATHSQILMELFPEDFADKIDEVEDKLEEGETEFEKLLDLSTDTPAVDDLENLEDDVDQIGV